MPYGINEGMLQLPKQPQACTHPERKGCAPIEQEKLTQEELDRALELDRIADRELDDTIPRHYIGNVMSEIEDMRKKRLAALEKSNGGFHSSQNAYTQAALAEKAGISLSAYKNYLSGESCNVSLLTVLKLSKALDRDLAEILKSAKPRE